MQVQIHTDTLNESGFYEDTMAAIGGRTIHTYHSEGAGGGHAPDIIRVAGEANCLPSSTNPTNPYTRQHVRRAPRHGDGLPSPEPARARGRGVRRVADPPRDDRGRGRAARPRRDQRDRLRLAGHGPDRRDDRAHLAGRVAHEVSSAARCPRTPASGNDNHRIKRYVAKLTINPARIYGIDHEIGSLEPGKLADIVLWEPKFFGIKPEVVFKGGLPRLVGDGRVERVADDLRAAGSTGRSGAPSGRPAQDLSVTFMAQAAIDAGVAGSDRPAQALRRNARHAHADQARHAAERCCADITSIRRPTASRSTASLHLRAGGTCSARAPLRPEVTRTARVRIGIGGPVGRVRRG